MAKPHVSLNVSSVERSVAFYTAFLGVEPVKLKPDYAKFDLADPPLNLTMNERRPAQDGEHGRLSHLGIQVDRTYPAGGHVTGRSLQGRLGRPYAV